MVWSTFFFTFACLTEGGGSKAILQCPYRNDKFQKRGFPNSITSPLLCFHEQRSLSHFPLSSNQKESPEIYNPDERLQNSLRFSVFRARAQWLAHIAETFGMEGNAWLWVECSCILQYSARVFLAQHLCHFSFSASIFLTWRRRSTILHRKYFRKTFLLEVVSLHCFYLNKNVIDRLVIDTSFIHLPSNLSLHVILCFISYLYRKFNCVPWKPWIWYQCVHGREWIETKSCESGAWEHCSLNICRYVGCMTHTVFLNWTNTYTNIDPRSCQSVAT